jgi:hypothetical protein
MRLPTDLVGSADNSGLEPGRRAANRRLPAKPPLELAGGLDGARSRGGIAR